MNPVTNIDVPVVNPESSPYRKGGYGRFLADFLVLTKARVNLVVVATAFAGFALQARSLDDVWLLLQCLGGTGAVAGGAAATNQLLEWRLDQGMGRTRNRPIAAGRIRRPMAVLLSGLLVAGGCLWLWRGVNGLASLFAGISFLIYAFLYTPAKRLTPLCTLIGAVAGALPFLVGWVAVHPRFDLWALTGFAVLYFWQVPHFLAIAWWRREEYNHAGFRVLPRNDHTGKRTAWWAVLGALVLLASSLVPAFTRSAAPWYGPATAAIGLLFLGLCFRFARQRTVQAARTLFFASLIYLPGQYILMLLSRLT
jgi:protoheme IX farnesyltransferase